MRDQGNPEQRGGEPGRVEKWGLKRQTIEDPPPCRYSVPLSLPTRLCSTVATCRDGSAAAKKGPAFQERVSGTFWEAVRQTPQQWELPVQGRPWFQGHGKHSPHEHRGLLEVNMKTALPMDAEKWKLWHVAPPTIFLRHHHTSETILGGLDNLSHPLHPHTSAYNYIMYGDLPTVCSCSPKGTAKSFRRPQRNHPALRYVCFPYN